MRTLHRLLLGVTIAIALVVGGGAPPVAAVDPAAALRVRFTAGSHVAYQVTGSTATVARTVTLSRPSSASLAERRAVGRTGMMLRLANGLFAGLWVRESGLRYVPGEIGTTVASPARVVGFGVEPFTERGTFIGYQFDASGALVATKVQQISGWAGSSAHGDRDAVINGRWYVRILDGIWAGYWMPTANRIGNASRVTCTAGNRPAAGSSQVLSRVTTAGSEVALTFDMGGRLDPASAILEYLLLERVCTTVFPTGAAIATPEGAAAMAVVRAHPELFEVGNHTQNHCNLRDGGGGTACPATRPSAAFVAQELADAAAAIAAATGQSPSPYWRPPFGAQDAALRGVVTGAGYTKTVMWAVDTIDWRPVTDGGPTALGIATKIRGVPAGGIVLLHLGGWNTLDGLPYGIYGLRARHLLPTSVSDLLP